MATVILVRHGRTTANASGMLAGRQPGVKLDEVGQAQADAAGLRLSSVPLAAIVTSPLERCRQTARALVRAQAAPPHVTSDRGITECDYGEWQGRQLKDLAKEPLWSTVQTQPSAAAFPGGETMAAMQHRAVAAVRRHDAELDARAGAAAIWVAVSHGDVIKSILADALGMHLDLFQRLHVDPASISIVRYTGSRPYVVATNTRAGDLGWLVPPAPKKSGRKSARSRSSSSVGPDAMVGGGAGPSTTA